MPAVHKSTTYKPGPVPNPFHQGGDRAYADILLHSQKNENWWKYVVGIGSLVLFAVSLVLYFVSISRQQTVPVLVNVMPSGESSYLGEVRNSGDLNVPEAAITFQIRKFITNIRSISAGSQVLYNNINECYAMVSSTYGPIMTHMLRTNSPFPLVGKIRRTVEIESILHITSNSYQVDWAESSIEPNGTPSTRKMRGLLTIKLIPPEPSFIKDNPLGIFIEACEWTEI